MKRTLGRGRALMLGTGLAAVAMITLASAGTALAQGPPSSAPPGGAIWHPFGDGHWAPNAGSEAGHGLVTTSVGYETYGGAGIKANMLPTTNPKEIDALSFDFKANQTGASGGSPRMIVWFSDGGAGELRPLTWAAGEWQTVNGMEGNNWDNNGGTCGYKYAVTWNTVLACHPEATIAAIYVVNDSGWLYPGGEEVVLDNLTVNDTVAAGPGASR